MDALDIALALLLVGANGFFVATEFALARVRPGQVEAWVREGRPGSRSVKHGVDHIDAYLAACQLGITVSSLGLGALGEPAFHHLLEPVFGEQSQLVGIGLASAAAFGIITLLHVVVGELAPKSVAISRTMPVVLAIAPIMRVFYLLTRPLVDLFNGMGNLLLKPFGVPPAREAGHAPASEAELRTLLRESAEGGEIEAEEQRFGENVLTFGDRRVREVMIPRHRAVFVTADRSLDDVVATVRETGLTRLPLCRAGGGLDAPVGLITLEDVLEEIVGEIEDEFDPEEREPIARGSDGTLTIAGWAPIRLVEERLEIELEDHHEATVGGVVLERLGRLPEPGEEVELEGVKLEVVRAEDAQIQELRLVGGQDAG